MVASGSRFSCPFDMGSCLCGRYSEKYKLIFYVDFVWNIFQKTANNSDRNSTFDFCSEIFLYMKYVWIIFKKYFVTCSTIKYLSTTFLSIFLNWLYSKCASPYWEECEPFRIVPFLNDWPYQKARISRFGLKGMMEADF